jgi:cytochrome b subunit of formate dehydrogenase
MTGLLLLAAAMAPAARAIDNAECFACHSDKDLVKTNKAGKVVSLFVDEKEYSDSIHGKNLCTSCHTEITELPHPDGYTHKPVSCGACHRLETDIYLKSDHGLAIHNGITEAASCKDCHGHSHTLLNYRNPKSPVNRANIPATCGACHANTEEMEKHKLRQRGAVVTYEKSVHGVAHSNGVAQAAVCTDCHGSHDLHRSTNPQSKLYWQTIPTTCGKCHENVKQTYARSIHGKAVASGIRDAPTCTDCHGEHTIQAVKQSTSKTSPGEIRDTCAQCHGAERIASRYQLSTKVVESYAQSFHGLAQAFGGVAAANCSSCHGFHDILPSSDPLSAVNKQNLPMTCGKCHPGIGTRLAKENISIHNIPGGPKGAPWVVELVTQIYIVLIVLTIGGMAIFNGLDYLAKTRAHIRKIKESAHGELRMTNWVRYQHLSMMILFVALVYTGFVHKYPDAFWSWPFKVLENGGYIRGMIHRIAGWAFTGLFFAHLIALFCTPRGHAYIKELWFRLHDIKDGFNQFLYNIGLCKTPPPPRRFNYAEKAEYWALVWGSFVMIITGIMLIFTELAMRALPKVWLDLARVIHLYEAVLATLAIVVWHFYWVIFDPKEYPMNPAWLIGKKAPHQPDHPPVAGTETSAASSQNNPGGHNTQEQTPHAGP